MSGVPTQWNSIAVDQQPDSLGEVFRYNQAIQQTSPSLPQVNDEVHLNYCLQTLLENSQLPLYHSIINLYLSLDTVSFQSILQLRMHSPFQQDLSSHHASLFSSPPQELWNAIVRLRYHPTWPHSQRIIIEALNSRMVHDLQRSRPQLQHAHSSGPFSVQGRRPSEAPLQSPGGSSGSSPIGFPPSESILDPMGSSKKSIHSQELFKNSMSKTAPPGSCWKCPSANCKKHFVRMGHLKNHLAQLHPDFLSCHADYDPDDYLASLPPSRTPSDENQSGNLNRNAARLSLQNTITPSERPRAKTRTPSFNPLTVPGTQPSGIDIKSKNRPGIIRHHSDSAGWSHGGMLDEFNAPQSADFAMTGVSFSSSDPFQQAYFSFGESEDAQINEDVRQFSQRPPDSGGNQIGSSASPGH